MVDLNTHEFGSFIKEIKQRIYNSQYEALKVINKALIIFIGKLAKKSIISSRKRDGVNPSLRNYQKNYKKSFPKLRGFLQLTYGECVIFL